MTEGQGRRFLQIFLQDQAADPPGHWDGNRIFRKFLKSSIKNLFHHLDKRFLLIFFSLQKGKERDTEKEKEERQREMEGLTDRQIEWKRETEKYEAKWLRYMRITKFTIKCRSLAERLNGYYSMLSSLVDHWHRYQTSLLLHHHKSIYKWNPISNTFLKSWDISIPNFPPAASS